MDHLSLMAGATVRAARVKWNLRSRHWNSSRQRCEGHRGACDIVSFPKVRGLFELCSLIWPEVCLLYCVAFCALSAEIQGKRHRVCQHDGELEDWEVNSAQVISSSTSQHYSIRQMTGSTTSHRWNVEQRTCWSIPRPDQSSHVMW